MKSIRHHDEAFDRVIRNLELISQPLQRQIGTASRISSDETRLRSLEQQVNLTFYSSYLKYFSIGLGKICSFLENKVFTDILFCLNFRLTI